MYDYDINTLANVQAGHIHSSKSLYLWTLLYISGLSEDQLTKETVAKILHFMNMINAEYAGRWTE